MNKPVYEPVKTPLSRKLEYFRLRYLPVIVFLVILGIVISLWNIRVYNPTFVGKVEGDMAWIAAPETGVLTLLAADQFDRMQQGDTLLVIQIADTLQIQSQLEVLRAQIDLLRSGQDPVNNWQRNRINYAGLQLDLMQERIALATLEVRRQQLSRTVSRQQQLAENQLVAAQELELVELELDLVETEIQERDAYIRSMESLLGEIDLRDDSYSAETDDPIVAAVRVHEREIEALEQQLKPRVVLAPFDGLVSQVLYPQGTIVPQGGLILRFESITPRRIVGHLRQPLLVRPQPGDQVNIRTRTPDRLTAATTITRVGAQFVLIDETLQRPGIALETGLPLEISLEGLEDMPLVPGEVVDVILP